MFKTAANANRNLRMYLRLTALIALLNHQSVVGVSIDLQPHSSDFTFGGRR